MLPPETGQGFSLRFSQNNLSGNDLISEDAFLFVFFLFGYWLAALPKKMDFPTQRLGKNSSTLF